MAISTAIGLDRVSRVVGYKLKPASFGNNTPYLPQRIAIIGEANTANQAGLTTDPFEFISAKEVGDKYGYGSPLHQIARILRPRSGNILGGITTVIYPTITDVAATVTKIVKTATVATTVTANATHYIVINGRNGIDGVRYAYNVAIGDSAATVLAAIVGATNNVLGSPVAAVVNTGKVDFTSKWKGITSAELNISFDTNGNAAGIVYAEDSKTDGAGVVTVATSLALFGANWNTLIINAGVGSFADYEIFNGKPDPITPTGRFIGDEFKPCVVFTGSKLSTKAALIALTDAAAHKVEVTNVLAPAPNSTGWSWEAATNMVAAYASVAQNTPHVGNGGLSYPDMPTATSAGDFATFDGRDYLVQRGCSTVNIENGAYVIYDMVTTYHPDGETPPKFRFVRDLIVDFNIAFGWKIIMNRDIHDKTLVGDNDSVNVNNIVSPKQGKQLLRSYVASMASLALIADAAFSVVNLTVGVNGTNPARLDFYFPYKRTSVANIVSTDAAVDFAFSL